MQHNLLQDRVLSLTPEAGRNEPRLWVRRLVVWREPGQITRDVSLKPGLNIIWSPDPGVSGAAPIGHGSGKTTFCRLLRYCLGEDSFAPDGQRRGIWEKFPNGHVGAEIILEGRLWAVVRALGYRRRDVVVENGSLDDAFRDATTPTGISPLREAITHIVLGDAAELMPATVGQAGAWEAALAWATRDQECRFGHHLDWRDSDTDSQSPVRRLSRDGHLVAVRALIGAISTEEIAAQRRHDDEAKTLAELQSEFERRNWQIRRTRADLAKDLGTAAGPGAGSDLDAVGFKAAAAERLAKALNLPVEVTTTDLERARRDRDAARTAIDRLDAKLKEVSVRIDEKTKASVFVKSELPEAYARLAREKNPICPICKVPIDKVLAAGCGISAATCDLESLQASITRRRENVETMSDEIARLEGRRPGLKVDIAVARQRLDLLEQTVEALERASLDRSTSVRAAERLVDNTEHYERLLADRTATSTSMEKIEQHADRTRDSLAAHRASVADTVRRLSTRFDTVLRELVLGEIKGEAKLDGNGLSLRVELGGERSTAAIESLKVVAFDLAALAMTIEGRTRLPGFLVHDSPREADLGVSIYHRLFTLARSFEGFGPGPLFQYIVTTTTEPPEEFRSPDWLRLTIHGSPAAERLLRVDL